MSCGLTKLATSRNGFSASVSPGGATGVAIVEPGDDAVGDERVAADAGVAQLSAVRFGADPAGESVRVEDVGATVLLDAVREDVAVVVVGVDTVAVGIVKVGVADVPFAVVVGVVARGAEPVAERGHLALTEPAHARIVGHLAEAVGLGHAVDLGVLPGEERRATRHAREGTGVVATEGDGVVLEPGCSGKGRTPPGSDVVRFVRRRRAFLVGHDQDDIGSVLTHEVVPVVQWFWESWLRGVG